MKSRAAIILCMEFFASIYDPAYVILWISHSEYIKCLSENVRGKLLDCFDPGSGSLQDDWTQIRASLESLLWVLMIGIIIIADTDTESYSCND